MIAGKVCLNCGATAVWERYGFAYCAAHIPENSAAFDPVEEISRVLDHLDETEKPLAGRTPKRPPGLPEAPPRMTAEMLKEAHGFMQGARHLAMESTGKPFTPVAFVHEPTTGRFLTFEVPGPKTGWYSLIFRILRDHAADYYFFIYKGKAAPLSSIPKGQNMSASPLCYDFVGLNGYTREGAHCAMSQQILPDPNGIHFGSLEDDQVHFGRLLPEKW